MKRKKQDLKKKQQLNANDYPPLSFLLFFLLFHFLLFYIPVRLAASFLFFYLSVLVSLSPVPL